MSPQAAWMLVEEIAPRLRNSIPSRLKPLPPEDSEELRQDTIAMAAQMLASAERNGKDVTPGNIVYFTLKLARSGRRSTGFSKADAFGLGTRLKGRSALLSMDEDMTRGNPDSDGPVSFHDLLATGGDDPSTAGARHVDWEEFMKGLSRNQVRMLTCVAEGNPVGSLTQALRVSASKLSEDKGKLAARMKEFFGPEALKDVMEAPLWRAELRAQREKSGWKRESSEAQGERK